MDGSNSEYYHMVDRSLNYRCALQWQCWQWLNGRQPLLKLVKQSIGWPSERQKQSQRRVQTSQIRNKLYLKCCSHQLIAEGEEL
jgi:hypothetical protein